MSDQGSAVDVGTSDGVQTVDVQVTLTGGICYSSMLPSNSPILRDLHAALALAQAPDSRRPSILMQLPLDGGRAACSFMSASLVSVTTTPPVLIQSPPVSDEANGYAPGRGTLDHVRIDDFLTPDENKQLLDYALEKESEFQASSVTTRADGYRKSRVLFAIKDSKWRDIFLRRLVIHLPHILPNLDVSDFRVGETEIQLTASNDGDYFKPHADASRDGTAAGEAAATVGREITYVYYLYRMPRPFVGGSLLIYQGEPGQFAYESGKVVGTIEPRNNSLIAFRSNRWHEVDMVRCTSGEFADSRFTVNGWLRRKER